jgi:tRNA threonylcarbamoyladenosine biosynthesis protein TsaE
LRLEWPLQSSAETEALGAALGRACPLDLPGPRLLLLSGELGSGKTTLAAALLAAMGAGETVRSPSYALLETYTLPAGLAVHVDCYRLSDPDELEPLGLRDYFVGQTLLLIEWPERAGSALPVADLALRLEVTDTGRNGVIAAGTDQGELWLQRAADSYLTQI